MVSTSPHAPSKSTWTHQTTHVAVGDAEEAVVVELCVVTELDEELAPVDVEDDELPLTLVVSVVVETVIETERTVVELMSVTAWWESKTSGNLDC